MIASSVALLFLPVAGLPASGEGGQMQETGTMGQEVTLTERDNSNAGRPSTGRILSRRETRLETRITREDLISLGQGNEAARTSEDARALVGRRPRRSGSF